MRASSNQVCHKLKHLFVYICIYIYIYIFESIYRDYRKNETCKKTANSLDETQLSWNEMSTILAPTEPIDNMYNMGGRHDGQELGISLC